MIDPLFACSALAKARNIWFHVDAARGGAIVASQTHRGCIDGIERADPITVDAHKMVRHDDGCGMLLTRWPQLLASTFQVSTNYMPSSLTADPYVNTAQWSRRFLGLRLFRHSQSRAGKAIVNISNTVPILPTTLRLRLTRGAGVSSINRRCAVCMEPPEQSNIREIVDRACHRQSLASVASFEGREVISVAASGETTENDVADLVECLEEAKAWTVTRFN